MAESYGRTTTVTTETIVTSPNIRFDPSYIRTLPGMLKAAQIILNLLGFICITVSHWGINSRGSWFNTVAMVGFWFTGILLVFYLFHVIEKFFKVPWLKVEFGFCALWTFFYLLAAALVAGHASLDEAFGVAAFFGFCAMVAYGFDAFLKFNAVKSGELAQGEKTTTTETVSPTAY
ncbi:hypothetical protein ONE63_005257 [Megalurothrips usitatus]|uniref:MARVEL domain-containing protein n=1 Tax=Megalurothrips usitatus TaxID=439358 RepID=A0AAV7XYY8_9NEOP|nr:hypothetical protein ONE63_005257 [Megalurothrips usitatus]